MDFMSSLSSQDTGHVDLRRTLNQLNCLLVSLLLSHQRLTPVDLILFGIDGSDLHNYTSNTAVDMFLPCWTKVEKWKNGKMERLGTEDGIEPFGSRWTDSCQAEPWSACLTAVACRHTISDYFNALSI